MSEYTLMRNKGKYTFECEARELEFEKMKSQGWEDEYKQYRYNWLDYPKQKKVSEYPLNVDIELTTICNLKCPMCFTISEKYNKFRKQEFMTADLFKKIIDEIADKVPAIRFSSSGEQTLHPQFLEFVAYAKKAGIKEISMVTNGSKLTRRFLEELVKHVDWIIISIDGLKDKYEQIRYPMKFDQIVESLNNLKQIKEINGVKKPVVQVQSVWTAIECDYEKYYEFFKPITDLMQFGILIDYEKEKAMNSGRNLYEEGFSCPAIYQRVEIGFDGKVYPCCANNGTRISIGNMNDQPIKNIWHGECMSNFRKLHLENKYEEISMCKDCFLARKISIKEIKKIENRKFEVKEYLYNM